VANSGFKPNFVMFDGWYASIENLKFFQRLGWRWFSHIKRNRMVNPDNTGNVPVFSLLISEDGMEVHMKKYGFVKIFHTRNKAGKNDFWPQIVWKLIMQAGEISKQYVGQ